MVTIGVVVVALMALATTVIFTLTDLDLWVAHWFSSTAPDGHGQWAWDHYAPIRWLYHYGTWPAIVVGAAAAVVAAAACWEPSLRHWRRGAVFLLLSLILGPGLLVNAIGKDHTGRPRPRDLVEFGGDRAYAPPGTIQSDTDGKAKAFPCGHSSIGFALGLSLCLVWWRQRPRLAWCLLTLGVLYGLALGLARISVGAHFLSDVLWSAYIPALVALPLWRICCPPEGSRPLPGPALTSLA
jgi:lipid A 4'-phosphatase